MKKFFNALMSRRTSRILDLLLIALVTIDILADNHVNPSFLGFLIFLELMLIRYAIEAKPHYQIGTMTVTTSSANTTSAGSSGTTNWKFNA